MSDGKKTSRAARLPASSELTLRDYFAAQALQGLLATDAVNGPCGHETLAGYAARTAENSYLYADAMLAERSKRR